jgi:predicted nucleic acid-binding protein
MRALVVDASVAVKWVVEEEGSEAAASLAGGDLAAPTLLLAECANVLWAKARRGELNREEALQRLQALRASPLELFPLESLVERALELAYELNHPAYDAFYLALAERLDRSLVTDDRRLHRVTRGHPAFEARVLLLEQFTPRT